MTHEEIARRLRTDVTDYHDAVRLADELDPPQPKIDRTVRGFARLKWPAAEETCIAYDDDIITIDDCYSWGFLEKHGVTITPIRELKPGQIAVDRRSFNLLIKELRYAYENGFLNDFDSDTLSEIRTALNEAERMGAGE